MVLLVIRRNTMIVLSIMMLMILPSVRATTMTTTTKEAEAATQQTQRVTNHRRRRFRHLSGANQDAIITGELPPLSPTDIEDEDYERLLSFFNSGPKFHKKKKKGYKLGPFLGGPYFQKKNGIFSKGGLNKTFKNGAGSLFYNNKGHPGPKNGAYHYAGAYNAAHPPPRPPLGAIVGPLAIVIAIGACVAYKFFGCCNTK